VRHHIAISVVVMMTVAPSGLLARSAEIPNLDVRPVCRGIASQSADPGVGQQGDRASTFQRCMESEQAVREQLTREWSAFSAGDKQHCITLATTGGESSNTELLTCLEMARDVRALRSAAAAPEGDTAKPASSPSMPAAQPTPAGSATPPAVPKDARKTEGNATTAELELARSEAQTAKAAEALAERKLADAEAALALAKKAAGRAAAEAERAKADAQAAKDSEAAAKRKLADVETARMEAEKACRPGFLGRLRGLLKRPSSKTPQ